MNFCTFTYGLFLAVVFAAYWWLRERRLQNWLIVAAGFFFYGWWDWRFCGLLLLSPTIDWVNGLVIGTTRDPRVRRLALCASLVYGLGLLSFFKYFGFLNQAAVDALAVAGIAATPLRLDVILPLGISFYLFQSLGYVIDVYRGAIPACRSFRDYLAFVVFFPQMVAGPIERAGHLLGEIQRDRRFDAVAAADGCRQILWGAFKKMVLADNLALLVEPAYADPTGFGGGRLALATVFFAFQIYCDFSGYSDIAIGTGRLFGIDLMRNFNHPYFASDPADFWRRWHISLSQWFRDYLFILLGGSRGTGMATARNVLVTFVVSGLWHGAGYNFLIWGLLNGLLVLPFIVRPRGRPDRGRPPAAGPWAAGIAVAGSLATFAAICATWVFFRARTPADAIAVLTRIVTDPAPGARSLLTGAGRFGEERMILLVVALLAGEWLTRHRGHVLEPLAALPRPVRWGVCTALVWAILFSIRSATAPFIYFQF
jgi:alginate O-acetyltransferase complex protein AlgI